MAHLNSVAGSELQCLDGDEIALAESARNIRRCDNRAGGAIAHAATVINTEWIGDHGSIEHLLLGDTATQVRLWIERTVFVALPRHMRHGLANLVHRESVPGRIGAGELSKRPQHRAAG